MLLHEKMKRIEVKRERSEKDCGSILLFSEWKKEKKLSSCNNHQRLHDDWLQPEGRKAVCFCFCFVLCSKAKNEKIGLGENRTKQRESNASIECFARDDRGELSHYESSIISFFISSLSHFLLFSKRVLLFLLFKESTENKEQTMPHSPHCSRRWW